jgi:hypothetical protein
MLPMLGRVVVEGEQRVAVLIQALPGAFIFQLVLLAEMIERLMSRFPRFGLPDFMKVFFRPGLNALRKFIERVDRLVEPAALLSNL